MPNETSIMEQVLAFHDKYDFNSFTAKDVQNALNKDRIDFYDYAALLSPAALPFLEKMMKTPIQDAYDSSYCCVALSFILKLEYKLFGIIVSVTYLSFKSRLFN